MKITIEKVLGSKKYVFELDGANFGEAYRNAAKIDLIPTQCLVCGSPDLSVTYRKPQGYEYPGVKCNSCGAAATIHTKKDGSEDYLGKMERYVPKESEPESPRHAVSPQEVKAVFQPGQDTAFYPPQTRVMGTANYATNLNKSWPTEQ